MKAFKKLNSLQKTGTLLLAFGLGILGAKLTEIKRSPYPYTRLAIVHDYMFENALVLCKEHKGFHYMVHESKILAKDTPPYHTDDYPCEERTLIRCQDGTLQQFETGVAHCFISEMQIDDTLKNKDVTNEYK